MSAADVVVLVAAVVGCVAALVLLVVVVLLSGHVRRLERAVERLADEAVPLVGEAREASRYAAGELARVDAVLASTEAVTSRVDSASRLAQRAFANPVVKFMAYRAGTATGWKRLREPSPPNGKRTR